MYIYYIHVSSICVQIRTEILKTIYLTGSMAESKGNYVIKFTVHNCIIKFSKYSLYY